MGCSVFLLLGQQASPSPLLCDLGRRRGERSLRKATGVSMWFGESALQFSFAAASLYEA